MKDNVYEYVGNNPEIGDCGQRFNLLGFERITDNPILRNQKTLKIEVIDLESWEDDWAYLNPMSFLMV